MLKSVPDESPSILDGSSHDSQLESKQSQGLADEERKEIEEAFDAYNNLLLSEKQDGIEHLLEGTSGFTVYPDIIIPTR